MAEKKNAFTPALVELLDSLTDLTYVANLYPLVLKKAIKADVKEVAKTGLKSKFGAWFFGTSISIVTDNREYPIVLETTRIGMP